MFDAKDSVDPSVVREMWASGFVNRWHTNPDHRLRNAQDTTAAHAQRVATLVAFLSPGEVAVDVVLAALWHDAAEVWTGDMPGLTKRSCDALCDELDRLETVWWKAMGYKDSPPYPPLISLADNLDAWLFVQRVAPDLLLTAEWGLARQRIVNMATGLAILTQVEELMG